jgi:A/G-specific adenine glycosylase
MTIPSSEKKHFQQLVLERYSANKRDLPWRKTTDPYKIMVSEVMLQQTQVPRVIQKFTRWMELWPTVSDLANAPREDVLREWSGLGFNRRAINLHEACKKISDDISNSEFKMQNSK